MTDLAAVEHKRCTLQEMLAIPALVRETQTGKKRTCMHCEAFHTLVGLFYVNDDTETWACDDCYCHHQWVRQACQKDTGSGPG